MSNGCFLYFEFLRYFLSVLVEFDFFLKLFMMVWDMYMVLRLEIIV